MCLLVNQPATSTFSDDFLADVFDRNQDGLGVMYAEGGKLHIFKCLPANEQDFIDFYRKHADGRACVWHARMQTHGDIDLDNCHPYKVTDDVWLAHNGVLSSSNDADKTKSDTWHFIRNIIRPALLGDPSLLTDKNWQDFIAKMIGGSNKFALVRADGEIVVLNKQAGVTYQDAWLSNTYAWSYHRFTGGKGYTDMYSGYGTTRSRNGWYHGSVYDAYEDEYYDSLNDTRDKTTTRIVKGSYATDKTTYPPAVLTAAQVAPYVRAAHNQWTRRGNEGIRQWIFDAPHKAAALLSYWYEDTEDMMEELVLEEPETAAEWIEELFTSDSITPSMLS